MTNALPVHRMDLRVGDRASAPAAYVRALDLRVERLDQDYARTADEGRHQRYDYAAPVFGFACRLVYTRPASYSTTRVLPSAQADIGGAHAAGLERETFTRRLAVS